VVVYVAEGCHLCEDAVEVIEAVRREVPFELTIVDIGGDEELEARYRVELPVVEIDGARAFEYEVTEEDVRAALR
jgi:glutaredoxin